MTHAEIYRRMMGYGEQDVGLCELCPKRYIQIHHIEFKGIGGRDLEDADREENLIGLCSNCHNKCHSVGWLEMQEECKRVVEQRTKFLKKYV